MQIRFEWIIASSLLGEGNFLWRVFPPRAKNIRRADRENRFHRDCLPMIREKRDRKILVDRKPTNTQAKIDILHIRLRPWVGQIAPSAGISQSQSLELGFNGFNTATNTRWQKFSAQRGVGEINSRTFTYTSLHVLMVCFPFSGATTPYMLVESSSLALKPWQTAPVMRLPVLTHITTFQTSRSCDKTFPYTPSHILLTRVSGKKRVDVN